MMSCYSDYCTTTWNLMRTLGIYRENCDTWIMWIDRIGIACVMQLCIESRIKCLLHWFGLYKQFGGALKKKKKKKKQFGP